MNKAKRSVVMSAVLAGLLGAAAAWAQDAALPLPAEKQSGNVPYVTGGVPDEQVAAFRQARPSYPLGIEIYQKAGAKSEFTSAVNVQVIDKEGNVVLDVPTEGPYLWAKVPPGSYRVDATLNDKKVSRSVNVPAKGSTSAVLVFPQGTD
jgi:hypothetical protein